MDGIKHSKRFAETERLVGDYFRCHIAPVMSKTRSYLTEKQAEEMKEYSTSPGGILSLMTSSMQPLADPYQVLKATGEWNSKKTEDYIEMCKAEITGSEAMQQDLAYMAGQWRDAVVAEVGRERYDELSRELGGDLAYAYLDYRVEQLMIGRLVEERIPKSSADYIIRKAAGSSLLGLTQTLNRSPLAEEIEARGEAAYRPSKAEKGAGWLLGTTADAVMLGGAGSWAALARFVGADIAISAIADRLGPDEPETVSVEQCISKGVFGSQENVFDGFRREAAAIPAGENGLAAEANERLRNKIPSAEFGFTEWLQAGGGGWPWPGEAYRKREERYKDVPLVIAPGQEEAYLRDLAKRETMTSGRSEGEQKERTENERRPDDSPEKAMQEGQGGGEAAQGSEQREKEGAITQEAGQRGPRVEEAQSGQRNENGWEGLLRSMGLDGMGEIAGNLGYVMAMLPDVLLGAFTGRTQSLGLKDNLLPIASIVAGMFVRNPLLKMLLIGLGGANLLNKAGHEALGKGRTEGKGNTTASGRAVRYRRYADEPLDPRIVNPVLQGSTLVATIDRVPCTVQLSPTVADAYRAGALPLNTLANAVLAQSDRLREAASKNYDNGQQETILRSRGIQ
ncbi:Uncharacterised protein [Alistipes sp. cv1]|uniref:hypothetical protein n=1 Tax=Alistipes indistinctus TaxID=626932 RepID=UPI0006C34C81|nr:Uncharacterised protein [Faecalibacterium prausnitzii]